MTACSLSELVAALTGTDEGELARTTARLIQNWVTAGLVRPLGGERGGRGVHRQFDRHELRKVAVLLELERYELPWSVLRRAAGLFDDLRLPTDKLKATRPPAASQAQNAGMNRRRALLGQAIAGKQPVYLTMRAAEGELAVTITTTFPPLGEMPSIVVVNLTEVLRPYR